MAKNLLHCGIGFGVYRSTQLGHIPLFLLLYLLVGPSIDSTHRKYHRARVKFEIHNILQAVTFFALKLCILVHFVVMGNKPTF
jgi:hypothetical protein